MKSKNIRTCIQKQKLLLKVCNFGDFLVETEGAAEVLLLLLVEGAVEKPRKEDLERIKDRVSMI